MRLTFCAACGVIDDLEHHHLVTRAEGGSNDPTNLITLCSGCHMKLHVRQRNGTYNAREHIREGMVRAKERGVQLGRPSKFTPHQRQEVRARLEAGESQTDIARSYAVDSSTISRLAKH